jgi:isopropylmalate/homocitrate/citramalate synthase
VLGKKSGKASYTYQVEKFGSENAGVEQAAAIRAEVKIRGAEKKSLLTDEEFEEIVRQKTG